ncbi:hypothetical protein [Nitrosomonas communis]|uniref:Uncharacterized protein n=1 Tax=Nitrosomonas communis TaxID=44574 RepID=A0A1I4QIW3_9PROT|nr:hypothetical protein [Nitrosomonas communis]SFM40001.1 hypothetical protein SAMN05421863_10272 [Nitrosomonas communis]
MTLARCYVQINSRLSRRHKQATSILDDHVNGNLSPWEFRFLAEALLSNLWIDWNVFVKQVLLLSCRGTTTRSGVIVPARLAPNNTESRITYEFIQCSKNATVNPTKTYSGSIEPTWAHPDRIIGCISGLATSNTTELQNAFGSAGLFGPKRIHLVRNACAHKSKFNRNEVARALRGLYLTNHFLDPIDIIWGNNSSTNSIAIFEWIADLTDIADLATH